MTLFLCSKCHGKCQAEAEAGGGPTEGGAQAEVGLCGPPFLPGAPSDFPSRAGPSTVPSSFCPGHCDLVGMLPLFASCWGPDRCGSRTCQNLPAPKSGQPWDQPVQGLLTVWPQAAPALLWLPEASSITHSYWPEVLVPSHEVLGVGVLGTGEGAWGSCARSVELCAGSWCPVAAPGT